MADYYQVLGVAYDDPPGKIRARYRLLALQAHPDTGNPAFGGDLVKYAQAYRTLGHLERRRRYNETLGIFVSLRNLLPGAHLYQRLSLSSDQIANGAVVPLTFTRYEPCSLCWLAGCHRCNQVGMIAETVCVEVYVSPGVRNNAVILVEGQGGCSEPGGSRGDLFVYVTVR